jgi:hypothetical protein
VNAEKQKANLLGCQEKQNCNEMTFKRSSRDEKEERVGKGVGGGAYSFPTVTSPMLALVDTWILHKNNSI